MPPSDFTRILSKTEVQFKRASDALLQTRLFADRGDIGSAYGMAFTFEAVLEKTVLLARVLPAYTGHPQAAVLTEQLLEKSIPVEMGFTAQGWFCLRIPALLPKKEGGSAAYVRDFLYPAMRRFFAGKLPVSYPDCVLIFRHVYDQARPERAWRDHDNIEINIVADVIALYLPPTGWQGCRTTRPCAAPTTIAAPPDGRNGRRYMSFPAGSWERGYMTKKTAF